MKTFSEYMKGGGSVERDEFIAAVEKHRKTVFRVAYNITGNYEDAEDVAQEAFMKLYSSKKRFGGDEHVKAFLIRVAINAARSLNRSAWSAKRGELPAYEDKPYYDDYADRELFDCVMRLPPDYRTAVYLYYYEDYCTADAAKIMGISRSAMTTRLARARDKLKKTYAKGELGYEREYPKSI